MLLEKLDSFPENTLLFLVASNHTLTLEPFCVQPLSFPFLSKAKIMSRCSVVDAMCLHFTRLTERPMISAFACRSLSEEFGLLFFERVVCTK